MYLNRNKKSGFTLLEIIIVIIIVGVLAALALPQFGSVVERSRGGEALNNLSAVRGAVVRCGFQSNNDYSGCGGFANLDVDDPALSAGNHFTYGIAVTATSFTITATRNALASGDTTSTVVITQDDGAGTVARTGTGVFAGI